MKRTSMAQHFTWVALAALILVVTAPGVWSQGTGEVIIQRIDTSEFPTMRAYVSVAGDGGVRIAGLSDANFGVWEDGATVQAKVSEKTLGVQIALIIDASGSIVREGATGKTRLEEAKEAIDELVLTEKWIDRETRQDWVTVLVPEGDSVRILNKDKEHPATWTNDYNHIHNVALLYNPPPRVGNTPLFKMLFSALDLMDMRADEQRRFCSIIVFSDGIDVVSEVVLQDAVSKANARHVPIYSILLGPKETEAAKNLKRLSTLTGGAYYHYESLDSLTPLFGQTASQRAQYVLTWRSRIAQSGDHTLQVTVSGGPDLEAETSEAFSIAVLPPKVEITNPTSDVRVEHTVKVDEKVPEYLQPVNIRWEWPDGHPRQIVRAEYILDGTVYPVTEPPFDTFMFNVSALSEGDHSLQVGVVDDLGLRGESETVPIFRTITRIKPLSVEILSPLPGTRITREAKWWWVEPETIEPRTQLIEASWQEVDGHSRTATRAEYWVDGEVAAKMEPPAGFFEWDLSTVGSGAHVMQVRVADELGLVGESPAVPIIVHVFVPPRPSPQIYVALAVAFCALALALYVYVKRPAVVTTAVTGMVSKIKELTEPFIQRGAGLRRQEARAYLVVLEGEENVREPIPLLSENTRLGRDESLVTVVFQNRTVSRLQARIAEEQDSTFHIYDEGSTGGTYVNYEIVPATGQLLQHNDRISLGRVQLQFKLGGIYREERLVETEPSVAQPPGEPGVWPEGEGEETRPFEGQDFDLSRSTHEERDEETSAFHGQGFRSQRSGGTGEEPQPFEGQEFPPRD